MAQATITPTRRPARVVLAIAAIWSVGLLVAAAAGPVYSSSSASSTGRVVRSSSTLVQENGLQVLVPVGVPLLAVGMVALAVWRRSRQGRPGAGGPAWTVVALLGALTFVSMLTIGIFMLPVTALLALACALV